jgi:hypothetical protein
MCKRKSIQWEDTICIDNNSWYKSNWNICSWIFMQKQKMLACKCADRTMSYISDLVFIEESEEDEVVEQQYVEAQTM